MYVPPLLILPSHYTTVAGCRFHQHTSIYINLQKVEKRKVIYRIVLPYGCHHPSSLYTRTTADTDNKSASFFFSSQLPGGKVLGANNEKDQIKESIMPKANVAVGMKLLKLV